MRLWQRQQRPRISHLSNASLGVQLADGRIAIAHGERLVNGFWITTMEIEWEDGSPLHEGDRELIVAAFRDASSRRRKWTLAVDYEGMVDEAGRPVE